MGEGRGGAEGGGRTEEDRLDRLERGPGGRAVRREVRLGGDDARPTARIGAGGGVEVVPPAGEPVEGEGRIRRVQGGAHDGGRVPPVDVGGEVPGGGVRQAHSVSSHSERPAASSTARVFTLACPPEGQHSRGPSGTAAASAWEISGSMRASSSVQATRVGARTAA